MTIQNKTCTDAIFNEIKDKSIKLWSTYDDTYGYATEKINRIKDLENIRDNFSYILAMFDNKNLMKILQSVNEETEKFIRSYIAYGY